MTPRPDDQAAGSRHFVHIDGRRVHYRRYGAGPAVLALHGSPQSSRAMESLGRALAAQGLCAITPDTPGNGLSTPLPGTPSSADYADALGQFADALGLGRFALFGFHTGAATACVYAARHPDRVSAAVLNGLSAWTDEERADLLAHYLPPFVPVWDGAHMAWTWARVEEHTVFFPWHRASPQTRMVYDVPAVAATHRNALDLLESGDGYRAPYAAAFAFHTESWLHRVQVPALIAASALDPLRPHLDRPVFAGVRFRICADSAALSEAAADHLGAHPGDPAPPPPPSGADHDGIARGWTDGLAWSGQPAGSGRPLVLLHAAGGSRQIFDRLLPALAGRRPVFSVDLPGHGASAAPFGNPIDGTADCAATIAAFCDRLGLDRPAVAGVGFGATIAAVLAAEGRAAAAGRLGRPSSRNDDPVGLLAPSLAPQWDGGHLLRAFRIARWERLFDPWLHRDRAHARPQGNLDPADIQARALDLLLAGDSWAAALVAERQAAPAVTTPLSAAEDPLAWAGILETFG